MKKTKFSLFFLPFLFLSSVLLVNAQSNFNYEPMEAIPIFGKSSDFCVYLDYIYKFGIATVSICAVLMIIIGGFMYSTSAGNNASAQKAKTVITDALLGLVLAMSGWLLLWIINPDLTTCKLPVMLTPAGGAGGETQTQTTPPVAAVPDEEFKACDEKAKADLSARGISVKTNACSYQGEAGCTTVCQLPNNAIAGLEKVKDTCGNFLVTGGTEGGHASHGPGKPIVDIQSGNNEALTKCVYENRDKLGVTKMCVTAALSQYNLGCGAYRETPPIVHISF